MGATKTKTAKKPAKAVKNGKSAAVESGDVLTLAEAAAYLRVAEEDVVQAIHAQGLPGREFSGQWRILKSSLEDWLRAGQKKTGNEAFLALAGSWKDDPYADEMLKEIYKQRGRPMVEEEE